MNKAHLAPCPNFIAGEWIRPNLGGSPVFNPSTGDVVAECPMGGAAEVSAAVEAAAAAFPAWRDTPVIERARLFFRYRQLVEASFERLCASVSLEHGKTLAEAKGSIYRGLENIEYACGAPSLMFGDTLENVARNVDCETILQPLGVCVGITPFNFPAMVPLWMFPLALACGNTFVLKPSEKVPLTALVLIELLQPAPRCSLRRIARASARPALTPARFPSRLRLALGRSRGAAAIRLERSPRACSSPRDRRWAGSRCGSVRPASSRELSFKNRIERPSPVRLSCSRAKIWMVTQ